MMAADSPTFRSFSCIVWSNRRIAGPASVHVCSRACALRPRDAHVTARLATSVRPKGDIAPPSFGEPTILGRSGLPRGLRWVVWLVGCPAEPQRVERHRGPLLRADERSEEGAQAGDGEAEEGVPGLTAGRVDLSHQVPRYHPSLPRPREDQ